MSITIMVMGVFALVGGFVMIARKFKTASGIVIFCTGVVLLIAGSCMFNSDMADQCSKDGGTWTVISGRKGFCLTPDGRIINRG